VAALQGGADGARQERDRFGRRASSVAKTSFSDARRHPEPSHASAAAKKLLLSDAFTVKHHLGEWNFR